MTARASIIAEAMTLVYMPKLPPCDMPTAVEARARGRNRKLGQKCGCKARIIVDGKNLCIRHAQQTALWILLRGDEATA